MGCQETGCVEEGGSPASLSCLVGVAIEAWWTTVSCPTPAGPSLGLRSHRRTDDIPWIPHAIQIVFLSREVICEKTPFGRARTTVLEV